ncbi:MAG: TIGR02147 family protein [Chitinispirillaceae bacterium]|nr:TIGR02147 family protein [Chitinispirillaceae bacterium]
MTDLFNYIDFKDYLHHYYEEKKKTNYHFSYELLARKAGFNNKGFIFNIIKGTRKLTKSHCYKLSRALGHSKKEAEYFECIVAYAQARNEEERSHFLKQALQIAGSVNPGTRMLGKDQYEYYSTWYHSAIRSLINIYPVKDNYEQLCRRLSPPLTVGQVKKSIQLLERLGLIARGKDGVYRLTEKSIRTSREISQTARNQFHVECAELAKKSIMKDPPDSRHAVSITMGISKKAYDDIVNETQSFINALINRVKNDDNKPERVYQYELLLFPLSTTERTEK